MDELECEERPGRARETQTSTFASWTLAARCCSLALKAGVTLPSLGNNDTREKRALYHQGTVFDCTYVEVERWSAYTIHLCTSTPISFGIGRMDVNSTAAAR